jgi:hypothetical protein
MHGFWQGIAEATFRARVGSILGEAGTPMDFEAALISLPEKYQLLFIVQE